MQDTINSSEQQSLAELNKEKLENYTWIKNGKEVKFNGDYIDNFNYSGMHVTDLPHYFESEM